MKKILSLVLALMMCAFAVSAMAETAAATDSTADSSVIEISPVENGTVVPFTDHNFQITLPSDWVVLETTTEQTDAGIIFSCANPDGTRTFSIAYAQLDAAIDTEALATELAASYENVQMVTINDIPVVTYTVSANDVNGIATLNTDGTGLYQFVFYPASDAEYTDLSMQIAASINTIQ